MLKPEAQPLLVPHKHRNSSCGGVSDAESLDDMVDEMRDVGIAVDIKDGNFAWDVELRKADLEGINLQIDAGEIRLSSWSI